MSKRTKVIAAVVALVVVAGVAAYAVFGAGSQGPEVLTAKAAKQDLAVVVMASGEVGKGANAEVFAPTAGTLEDVQVSEGETVTAGQVLAIMDTAPIELQVAQAKAGVSAAESQLDSIGQQAPTKAEIAGARAAVTAAEKSYSAAKAQLNAIGDQAPSSAQKEAAAASTAAAKTAYDNAKAAYDFAVATSPSPSTDATVSMAAATRDQAYAAYLGAKAQQSALSSTDLAAARAQASAGVQSAQAALQNAKAQLSRLLATSTTEARAAAQASLNQAHEALAIAEKTLADATLIAPIDGTVMFGSVGAGSSAAAAAGVGASGDPTEGSSVSPAAPVFTIVNLDALKFSAQVDEVDIARIEVGMPAKVMLDAFADTEFATTVSHIDPTAQLTATGGTVFVVEFPLENTGEEILLNMKGDAEIEVSSLPSAITIPVEALFSEGDTDYVYKVMDGKLAKTEIVAGATTDASVEVLEGLAAGDEVALSGSVQYTDGMAVRVKQ